MQRIKTSFVIVITIISIITLHGMLLSCTTGGNELNVEISPQNKNIIELTSKVYEDSQLFQIARFNGSISELDMQYPIECLRLYNGNYRVSYLGIAKIAILVFDNSGNKLWGNICDAQKFESDFEELEKGQSLEDVQKIDPQGEYLFLHTGRNDTPKVSSHYTKDGYLIIIEYDSSNIVIDLKKELI